MSVFDKFSGRKEKEIIVGELAENIFGSIGLMLFFQVKLSAPDERILIYLK